MVMTNLSAHYLFMVHPLFCEITKLTRKSVKQDIQCTPQQPDSASNTRNDTDTDLRQRVEDLQGIVKKICNAIDLDVKSSNFADLETGTMEALRRLGHSYGPSPESTIGGSSVAQSLESRWGDDQSIASEEDIYSFEHAPLLNLFKQAMTIEIKSARPKDAAPTKPSDQRIGSYSKYLRSILPNDNDLTLILRMTERYWFAWKGFDEDTDTMITAHTIEARVVRGRQFILDSLDSGSPISIAKAVLNLALCIQQLPRTFDYHRTSLRASPDALVNAFANAADIIMMSENSGTLDGLDCSMMQYKLYINMGKPRKAWLSNRRAISSAILLNLHQPEGRTEARQKMLWLRLWQVDRILSITLGVPYTIPASAVDVSMRGTSVGEQVMFDVCALAGRVIDRDQSRPRPYYAVTEELDRDFQQCRVRAAEWWATVPTPDTPLDMLYSISTTKIQFFLVQKLLHLPYMLKSWTESVYERSRNMALETSRELIRSYQSLRHNSGEAVVICDLMDFQAFSAALTITISLLSPRGNSRQDDLYRERDDWDLVRDVTGTLKNVSESLQCYVSAQAARLLEQLYTIRHGDFTSTDGYEAIVPYFGKVRIAGVKTASPDELQPNPPGTVEFSANIFDYNNFTAGGFLDDAELGVDWTSAFEVDADFDWNQIIEGPFP